MQKPIDKPSVPAIRKTPVQIARNLGSSFMDDPSRFIVDHWLGIVIFTVGITLFSAVTQMGKPIWWTCAGTIILAALAIFIGFWKLDNYLESHNQTSRKTPNSLMTPTPATTPPTSKLSQLMAAIQSKQAVIAVGPFAQIMPLDSNGNGRVESSIGSDSTNPIFIKATNYIFTVSGRITDGQFQAELTDDGHGKFSISVLPAGWDLNADERAFEIVDRFGIPIFQLEYIDDLTVSMRGSFVASGAFAGLFHDYRCDGIRSIEELDESRRKFLHPIFLYPSTVRSRMSVNDGKRVPNRNIPPPPATYTTITTKPASPSIQSQATEPSPSQEENAVPPLEFKVLKPAIAHLGGVDWVIEPDDKGNAGPYAPIAIGSPPLFQIYAKANRILFDGILWDGKSSARLKGTRFLLPPDDWDLAYDKTAVEIVDATGKPIFQAEWESPKELTVVGLFCADGKLAAIIEWDRIKTFDAHDLNALHGARLALMFPLFQHPSPPNSTGHRLHSMTLKGMSKVIQEALRTGKLPTSFPMTAP